MKTCQQNWFIASKQVDALTPMLKQQLENLDVEILEGDSYIHGHFFIPEQHYYDAEKLLAEFGFKLTDQHPPVCKIGKKAGFEVFEKRVPLIEVREARALAELAEQGVSLSGGAGKPHVHLKISSNNRDQVLALLTEHGLCSSECYF